MHAIPSISAVVTSFNSARTIGRCLASLAFCDEILVLDSGSTDATRDIAAACGARVLNEPFRGYAAQKQRAVDLALHDWVLLLDSDEWLEGDAGPVIRKAVASGEPGFRFHRREWLFWRWQHPRSRHNLYVRLFDRRRGRLSDHAVHETVLLEGKARTLAPVLMHAGDPGIACKIEKANRYSSLQQDDLARRRRRRATRLRMVVYPSVAFVRYFFLRGHWREGWAGYVAARIHAFYAFAKYAKAYEAARAPDGAPQRGLGWPAPAAQTTPVE